jgi:hypothetical protein
MDILRMAKVPEELSIDFQEKGVGDFDLERLKRGQNLAYRNAWHMVVALSSSLLHGYVISKFVFVFAL